MVLVKSGTTEQGSAGVKRCILADFCCCFGIPVKFGAKFCRQTPLTVYNDSMNTPALTRRQQQILDFIQNHISHHQRPPTQAEITTAMGFRSRTATVDHLRALEKKGVLHRQPGNARGLQLLHTAPPSDSLPLIGRVAAGAPILAVENIQTHHAVDPSLFKPRADYLLQVHGQSMRDVGIADGDLLAVHQTPEARNGQIVVARLDEEVTVKRFQRDGDLVELLPANPDFAPIRIDLRERELGIEGLVVGLIRQHAAP